MLSANFVILTGFAYICLLFVLAWFSDKQAQRGNSRFLASPFIYTLSISVYCTSWTFYGAVGSAARNGLEFLTIYLGPTLVFVGWWFVLRKLVRIGRTQRITSIADLLSSRFGKSNQLAVIATLIAVIGTTPYIALQLKAITSSIRVISAAEGESGLSGFDDVTLAIAVATGMALFTILFGTRNVDAKEQHHGVVAAIAFEAVVKLLALLAVGVFVVFGVGGGFESIYLNAREAGIDPFGEDTFGPRWVAILVLSATAVLCLPRQFQITVVENSDENHLRTAGWAFPTYLLLMSLFTMPIALFGLTTLPEGSNPDMFVLTLPLASGNSWLALFAFIGGFSSATSMIIVATIALSIMVSNHIVMPIALRTFETLGAGDERGVTRLLLNSRRASIGVILFLGFLYYWLTGNSDALAAIGLISFAGVAQFLPPMIAALYWREATMKGAIAATCVGFLIWAWTMFLPSFGTTSPWVADLIANGPFGITLLKPQALFGLSEMDPLVHSVFWSLFLNSATLILVSLGSSQSALERIQATLFVDVFRRQGSESANIIRGSATTNDLYFVAQRVLGDRALTLFETYALESGVSLERLEPTPELIGRLERELAGSIGAASAHVMLSKVVSGDEVSLEEVMRIADETQQVIEYSQKLEQTSKELRKTAAQLQTANEQMHALDRQKDEFLSQVSHEVRTPMTSIRSFSEILLDPDGLTPDQKAKFVETIHRESLRLTKLLDEILDLNALERGEREWNNHPTDAEAVLSRAIEICDPMLRQRGLEIERHTDKTAGLQVNADPDRLAQVFINLITNAAKYNDADDPFVHISSIANRRRVVYEFLDNGPGIPPEEKHLIFEKFARGRRHGDSDETGAGLGLAISHQLITRMRGKLELVPSRSGGACFRVTLERAEITAVKQGKSLLGSPVAE